MNPPRLFQPELSEEELQFDIFEKISKIDVYKRQFQEVDIVGITRSITKYGVTVHRREDLGRIIKEAFYIARSGKPGPVLVDLPKDVMGELGSPEYPSEVNIRGYKPNTSVHIGQLKRAVKLLNHAKRPLFLAGGGVNIAEANEAFTRLVEKTKIRCV